MIAVMMHNISRCGRVTTPVLHTSTSLTQWVQLAFSINRHSSNSSIGHLMMDWPSIVLQTTRMPPITAHIRCHYHNHVPTQSSPALEQQMDLEHGTHFLLFHISGEYTLTSSMRSGEKKRRSAHKMLNSDCQPPTTAKEGARKLTSWQ